MFVFVCFGCRLSPEIYMKRPMVEGDHWRLDVILERKAVSVYGREKGGTQRGGGTLEGWNRKGWGHT